MRVLGFQKKWGKLGEPEFTTFRYPRADKDWQVGELVQVVVKPRSKSREFIGYAEITRIDLIRREDITEFMAWADGFSSYKEMMSLLAKTYGNDYRWLWKKPMNRITLLSRSRADINQEGGDDR